MAHQPDGFFLSNGPGDPAATAAYAVPAIQKMLASGKPIFGICLGHQLLGLAVGARTTKMHQGHRGANHPVKRLSDGRVEITSMNHGFAVDGDSLPANATPHPHQPVRRQQLRLRADRQTGVQRPVSPRSKPGTAGQRLFVWQIRRDHAVSTEAATDQQRILRFLYDRLAGGDARYCTIPTIRKTRTSAGPISTYSPLPMILRSAGTSSPASLSNVWWPLVSNHCGRNRLHRIRKRIVSVQSAAWTGRLDLSETRKAEIRAKLVEIRQIIEQSRLSNAQRANALAIIDATETLVETPDPLWPEIMRLLRSPVLSNLNGVASLVLAIVGIILTAASI